MAMPPDSKRVFSSNIDMVGYSPDQAELFVQFKTGAIYVYGNVDPKLARETMDAPSIGEAMQVIKKNPQTHPYRRIG